MPMNSNMNQRYEQLMVVLRESEGCNSQESTLYKMSEMSISTPDVEGNNSPLITADLAWYTFLGDMHLRFVFDKPNCFDNLTSKEFSDLKLSPKHALQRAVKNIKSVY